MSIRKVRYVFRGGLTEDREILADSWPAVILVTVHHQVGPPREARLLWTEDFKGEARIYQEDSPT